MRKVRGGSKKHLVFVIIGAIGSLVSAVAAVIQLVYNIRRDKKQESNPPDKQ